MSGTGPRPHVVPVPRHVHCEEGERIHPFRCQVVERPDEAFALAVRSIEAGHVHLELALRVRERDGEAVVEKGVRLRLLAGAPTRRSSGGGQSPPVL